MLPIPLPRSYFDSWRISLIVKSPGGVAMDELTREERLARIVDELTPGQLFAAMAHVVGAKRVAELTAWAIWWGLTGEESGGSIRKKLEARGMTERSAYRAASEYRMIGEHLLAEFGREELADVPAVMRIFRPASL